MLKGRRYRAHLTVEQSERAERWLGAQRVLWNLALEQRFGDWEHSRRYVGRFEQCRELKELRASFEWLKDVPNVAQGQLLADVDRAFMNWWGGSHGRPQWRRKHGSFAGMRFTARYCGKRKKINRRWSEIRLPKLGVIRYRRDREFGGELRSVTLKRDAVGEWWIAALVETNSEPAPLRENGSVVGVDLGIAKSAQASDGRAWQCPRQTRSEVQHRVRLERRLRRQKPGSKRWYKTKLSIAKIRRKDQRRRSDWAHKVSCQLVQDAAVVGFEDLNIRGMTSSAKGTIETPGTRVAAKSGLNRAILENGWGKLIRFTTYKGGWAGASVVLVPAAYTSQRCNACGVVDAKSRESQSRFCCRSCGQTSNADVNAAKNIENAAGRAVSGRGDLGVGRSVKRQPSEGMVA